MSAAVAAAPKPLQEPLQEPLCYVCLQESTQDNAFVDTGCACSDSMHIHRECLNAACTASRTTNCSICRQQYRDVYITVAISHVTYIEHATYLNGLREGLTSTYSMADKDLLDQSWYSAGKRTESHQYNPITGMIETVIRFDEAGHVTEYIRYDSYGDEVDYEDYRLDPSGIFEAEIAAAIEGA
jgi:hypothetical protein